MNCLVCSGAMAPFGSAEMLGKYTVSYFRCTTCGYIRTEEPYWLEEAYADAMNESDVGLVSRNLYLARVARSLILACFRQGGPFVDYGAGYGLFVRLMRDRGLDFYWADRYAANLFARVAVADTSGQTRYELLTAFELFEHLLRPADELQQMLRLSGSVLLTTLLIPPDCPPPGSWWYYGLDHGQHISFYTRRALEQLAARFGLNLYSDGRFIHLLTPRRIAPWVFGLAVNSKAALLLDLLVRGRSLAPADYQRVTGRALE
ncbi:MAG: class I SAM-dependent methyltransferase [Chloroflexales bacterium]|nr:class I SAM-dependent methyltransferase [Chloroflexales bacterium]